MYDIHTHLYWDSYDADRGAVIARARAAGVEKLFAIGCTVDESRQCVALAEQYAEIFASVGIHPHEFRSESRILNLESWKQELNELAQHPKVVAIGECGLDYYVRPTVIDAQQQFVGRGATVISDETKAVQKQGFLAQIELARELDLPLIVHCRPSTGSQDAYEDVFEILKTKTSHLKACILHCYMGDTAVTKRFLELPNVYFSFTGNITYPVKKALVGTKDDLTETVRMVPLERLFVETDCPFLAPQSKRGERNEPAYVALVADQVAFLKGVTMDVLNQKITENFQTVFKKAL
jgi:TatD DNase family protein